MTDFLTRMARSALGLMPVAKMLAASRYAPGPELPEQTVEQQITTSERLESQATETQPARSAAMVVRRAAAVAAPTSDATPVASTPAVHQTRAPAIERAGRVERADQPVTLERLRDATRREEPARPEREVRPAARADQPFDAEPPRSRRAIASSKGAERPPAEPAQVIETVEVTKPSAVFPAEAVAAPWSPPSHSSSPLIEAPEPRHLHASSPPVDVSLENALSPRTFESPLPARRDESGTETPAATPVIRVTIGRVEVRAVTPPPPAEPPPSPAPRISLDDYLRSHNRRTR